MTTEVFLSQLIEGGDINSRSDGFRDADIDSLANSILQLGLIQPLSVQANGEGYRVIDGNRRYRAIRQLSDAGQWDADKPIPVLVRAVISEDARQLSLAANVERVQLHPADEYEAFAKIAAEGATVEDIALRFGIPARAVRQRMALGRLIPEVLADYRENKVDGTVLKALANVDQDTQRKFYVEQGMRGWQLREALQPAREDVIRPDLPLAEFLGRDEYVAGGGTFVTDLFVDEDQQLWADPALAMLLAADKANRLCEQFLKDGWAFAERREGYHFTTADPEGKIDKKKFTDPADFKRWKELEKLTRDLPEDQNDWTEDQIADFEEKQQLEYDYEVRAYSPEQKRELGVVINQNWNIVEGVLPAAKPAEAKAGEDDHSENDEEAEAPEPKPEPAISNALNEELEGYFTRTAHGALADNPLIAKVVLIDQLWEKFDVAGYVHRRSSFDFQVYRNLRIEGDYDYGLDRVRTIVKKAGIAKQKTLASRMKAWAKLEDAELDIVLAWFIARSLVTQRPSSELGKYLTDLRIMGFLDHWKPTLENFFLKLTTAQLTALAAKEGIDIRSAMKKAELAAYVRDKLPEDWLPVEITG